MIKKETKRTERRQGKGKRRKRSRREGLEVKEKDFRMGFEFLKRIEVQYETGKAIPERSSQKFK